MMEHKVEEITIGLKASYQKRIAESLREAEKQGWKLVNAIPMATINGMTASILLFYIKE